MIKKLFSVLCLCLLAACANQPLSKNGSPEYLKANLVVGKTTKDDVVRAFGEPANKSYRDNGTETWAYRPEQLDGENWLDQATNYIGGVMTNTAVVRTASVTGQQARDNYNHAWLNIEFNKRNVVTNWQR
ncbi:hypothetical protein AMB3_1198 [plant metagenome]